MAVAFAMSAAAAGSGNGGTPTTGASTPAAVAEAAQAPPDRKYLLERVDDAAVVQLYADGFKDLPLEQTRSSGTHKSMVLTAYSGPTSTCG